MNEAVKSTDGVTDDRKVAGTLRSKAVYVDINAWPQASMEQLRLFVDNAPAAIAMLDTQMCYIAVSHRWLSDYSLLGKQLYGRNHNEVFPEIPKDWKEIQRRCLDGAVERGEDPFQRADGRTQWVRWEARPWHEAPGTVGGIIIFSEDITAHKMAEEKLHRLNRMLRALNNSNAALLRVNDEAEYLEEVCRIVVEDCGYARVLVGFAENDREKTIKPVASAGLGDAYLDKLRLSWADTPYGRGPAGTAIRTGRVCQCRDTEADPRFAPWRAQAAQCGFAAVASFPLLAEGHAFGVLNIYSRNTGGFDEEEERLLSELAADFAQGITTMRLRAVHSATNDALRISEDRFRTLFKTLSEGFCIVEVMFDAGKRPVDCRFLEANPAFQMQTGMAGVESKRWSELSSKPDASWIGIFGKVALTGKPAQFVSEVKEVKRWYDVHVHRMGDRSSRKVAVLLNDINERMQMEETLRNAKDEMEKRVQERTKDLAELNRALYHSERAMTDFFTQAPVGLSWLSAGGTILRVNDALLELLGCQARDCLGHFFNEFLVEPNQASEMLKKLAGREIVRNYRMLLRRKNGTILHVLADARPFWYNDRLRYLSVFLRDITDRVTLEKEILQAGERADQRIFEDLHDSVGQILAGAAYLANNLQKDLATKSLPEARQADRILELINESVTQTRNLARGLHPVEPEPNGLALALTALAAGTRNVFHVDCRFRCPRKVLIQDNVVSTHLFRIAQEAVTNAIKHAKPRHVKIDLTKSLGRINLSIRDDGAGLPLQHKKPGMGLRIMRHRAALIGGSLSVQRGRGGGTVVICTVIYQAGKSRAGARRKGKE